MPSETFWNYVMLIGLLSIFISGGLAFYELRGAKRYCASIDGEYDFDFPVTHLCNSKAIFKYDDGWDFERLNAVDVRDIKIEIPE